MRSAQQVYEDHMAAVATLNADNVVADYATDAVFITPDKTYNGIDEIKEFYVGFLPNMKDFDLKTLKQETHGNVAYLVWEGKNDKLDVKFCTDSYIVENGKIKYHTFAGIIE